MTQAYRFMIAGIKILLQSEQAGAIRHLQPFALEDDGEGDLLIRYDALDERADKRFLRSDAEYFFWYAVPGGYRLELQSPFSQEVYAAMDVDDGWRNAVFRSNRRIDACLLEGPLGEAFFRCAIVQRGGIQVHSAAVAYEGQGIVFSAPSGTGKTTHARLWVDHLGAAMLNGDRPMLCTSDDEVRVCGAPWSGSDPVYQNLSLPLAALVFLRQAPENRLEKLPLGTAVKQMMPRCFLPYFSEDMLAEAFRTIERILKKTPCYLLHCRPEREAAELLCQSICR
ncbi:MAG: hypothetical protein LBT22_05320 [Peptococcaceae bacterium]|jgi:hypothetical protein|nr:hypothetical protein [Peptococcaceae bacterium]